MFFSFQKGDEFLMVISLLILKWENCVDVESCQKIILQFKPLVQSMKMRGRTRLQVIKPRRQIEMGY